jgi:hypothetical protein
LQNSTCVDITSSDLIQCTNCTLAGAFTTLGNVVLSLCQFTAAFLITGATITLDYYTYRQALLNGVTFSITPTIVDGPLPAGMYEGTASVGNTVASVADTNFLAVTGLASIERFAAPGWVFTPNGFFATYTGPPSRWVISVHAGVDQAAAGNVLALAVSQAGSIIGAAIGATFTGGVTVTSQAGTEQTLMACQAVLDVVSGDVVRPVFAANVTTVPDDIRIRRINMTIAQAGP